MNLWPVYIPSRGRPNSKLFDLLPEALPVIEGTELRSYIEGKGDKRFFLLKECNQGIAYARNEILRHSRSAGHEWFWMLDDDISDFFFTVNKRLQRVNAVSALLAAQILISCEKNIGQAALEYSQFAWSAEKPVKKNGYCDVAVAVNTELTQLCKYRAEFNLKEDRDFTLQVLANGAQTMRCSQISFRAPKNGSNKGGLYEEYAGKSLERKAVDAMVAHWGSEICVPQTKKDGRYDLKINWKFFK